MKRNLPNLFLHLARKAPNVDTKGYFTPSNLWARPVVLLKKYFIMKAAAAQTEAVSSVRNQPAISHCLFDMDGLLLDTETLYTVAQQQVVSRYGKDFTWELKAQMMGKKALEAAQLLVDTLGLHGQLSAEQFLEQREEILDALFATAPLMPGVERLIRHLHACSVPIAVATSSHRRHFELKTSQHRELFGLFNHIITGDQVTKGKPAPDIFLQAAAAFSPPPSSPAHCLVFEDAPSGVAAACAAGMRVVMVPDPNLDRAHCADACCVVASLEHFSPADWGLPPFPS